MQIRSYLRSRLSRGLSLDTIGPNEARLVYDFVTGAAASTIATAFIYLLAAPISNKEFAVAALLPFAVVGLNAALGIYSRLRTASGSRKAAVLIASTLIAAVVGAILSNPRLPLLWTFLAGAPLVLPRVFLAAPNSRYRRIAAIAVTGRGPVLVIGGAGYIGSHTVDLLLEAGHEVRVLDKLMYGRDSLADFMDHPRFEFIEGDATDITKLTSAMRGASAVVHLAGLVGDPACAVDPTFTRHTNVIVTRMAKEVAQSLGVSRFVFASSCSVYGVSDKEVSEKDDLNPVSLYAQTKIDSERELLASTRDDFFVTVLRFATVFGHSRRPRFDLVANLFTAQAMTDGRITVIGPDQWRPFIHVRDLARAIAAVLAADPALVQSQVFNVGDRRLNVTILQLAEKVRAAAAKYRTIEISVSDNPQDRRNYAVSFDKIKNLLGFEAATLIEDGVEEMAARFAAGEYRHYREETYSNVAMTSKALTRFYDPEESAHLYAPLTK